MRCAKTVLAAAACLGWAGALPATDAVEPSPAGGPRRPNVLFVAVDDLNTRIGCHGDRIARTPHLDRLAQSGVRFDRAYCQFPLCNPSRMSLLLGRYPTTTQSVDFSHPALWGRDWVSLPQHFRNQGYDVHLLGKIFHNDPSLMKGWFHEETPGPEYPPDWSAGENWVLKSQDIHRRMMADLTRWEPYRTLAPPSNGFAKMLRTWANVFGPVPNTEEAGAAAKARAYEWTADVKSAADAAQLLRQAAASKRPFFLAVGFYKPHVPLVAPKRFFDMYSPHDMPLPPDFATTPTADDATPRYALRYNLDLFFEEAVTPQRAREAIAAYYACISFMDEKLGVLLDSLERFGLRDNTVIVLWGDHGWHLGEKGMWGKGTLFDVSAAAPLVIVDPRRKTASRESQGQGRGAGCPRTVEFVDIYPTLVELCGLPMPPGLEGKSLCPLLDNPHAAWTKPAQTVLMREDWLGRSIRTERFCYTEWDEGRRGVELYDLQHDPRESKNLAAAPAMASTVAALRKQLHASPVSKPMPLLPGRTTK